MTFSERIDAWERLTRLDKPIGYLLLLWPTLWGVWLSSLGRPDFWVVVVFVLGTVLMRSAGCIMNDIADRKFDPLVERTKDRPIAAGLVSVPEALALAAVLALCAFALAWQFHRLVVWLALPALFLAITYPYMKRFFVLPQAYLGVAFGFGIPMAYAANTGGVSWLAWYLLLANVFWTLAYDTEYAMVDRNDDVRLGIRTSAILFGRRDVAFVMAFHAIFLAMMTGFGLYVRLGRWYFAGIAVAAVLAALQYRAIRDRTREGCFRAFRANNWIGIAILAGIIVDFSVRRGWPPIRLPALG